MILHSAKTRNLSIYLFFSCIIVISNILASENQIHPSKKYTFCQGNENYYSVGIIGEDWALIFSFDKNETKQTAYKIKPHFAKFHRGPNIYHFVGRSAGPRRPPIPNNNLYSSATLENIEISLSQNDLWLHFKIKAFTSFGKRYEIVGLEPIGCGPFLP